MSVIGSAPSRGAGRYGAGDYWYDNEMARPSLVDLFMRLPKADYCEMQPPKPQSEAWRENTEEFAFF